MTNNLGSKEENYQLVLLGDNIESMLEAVDYMCRRIADSRRQS